MFRLAATVRGDVLQARHLPEPFQQVAASRRRQETSSWDLDTAIRRHIESALEVTGHNKTRAARLLGIPYTTLQSKLKKLGMLGL
jgi:DNA-binding NtrC family response regulator